MNRVNRANRKNPSIFAPQNFKKAPKTSNPHSFLPFRKLQKSLQNFKKALKKTPKKGIFHDKIEPFSDAFLR
jgi:hypothetical protein